jgi:hypothetical protein
MSPALIEQICLHVQEFTSGQSLLLSEQTFGLQARRFCELIVRSKRKPQVSETRGSITRIAKVDLGDLDQSIIITSLYGAIEPLQSLCPLFRVAKEHPKIESGSP